MTAAALSPTALVAEVRRLGVTLHVDDAGAIRAKPAGVLPAALRDQIRLHKDELVETLSQSGDLLINLRKVREAGLDLRGVSVDGLLVLV